MTLLIIDDDCGVCRASALWLGRRSTGIRILGNDDARLPLRLRRDGRRAVLAFDGRLRSGSGAVLRLLGATRRPWCLFGIALGIPYQMREAVYGIIARHRSWLNASCGLHAPAPMDRTSLRPEQGAPETRQ